MAGLGQWLPKRTLPVSVQVRNSLKADEGWNGKTVYTLRAIERNLSVLTRFRPLTLINQKSCSFALLGDLLLWRTLA